MIYPTELIQDNVLYKNIDKNIISSFRKEYDFLSNFSNHRVLLNTFKGRIEFQTSEHAFQAFKTTDPDWFYQIAFAESAKVAKELGKKCPIRSDWDTIKDQVMFKVLTEKFSQQSNDKLFLKLIDTYPRYLIEGNTWGDQYWGCTFSETFNKWIGKNKLGQLLMIVRYKCIMDQKIQRIYCEEDMEYGFFDEIFKSNKHG